MLILIGGMVAHPISYIALFLLITVLSLLEFYKLIKNSTWNIQPQIVQGLIAGIVLYGSIAYSFAYRNSAILAVNVLSIAMVLITELYRKKENPFSNIAYTLLGVFYLALPFGLSTTLIWVPDAHGHGLDFYPWIIFGSFMIVWANDSWAYLTGRYLGKHKLFERISPGKTWEGSAGGAAVALTFGYIMSLFFDKYTLIDWLVIAAILIVTSTLGDLVESMLKRSLGVKDSGTMLPGHGGVLDRFDGMYIALPVIWAYLVLFG